MLQPRELARTPDLVDLVSAARDAGHEVMLIERPLPDAHSVAGVGRLFDVVAVPGGAAVEDEQGRRVDEENGSDPLLAAARLWDRLASRLGRPLAIGGFAFNPGREPRPPWSGFPGLLFRVPRLAVSRFRGRSFATGDEELLEMAPAFRAPPARRLEVSPVRPEAEWAAAVGAAAARLRAGEAEKVVLAREVIVRADGVLAAGAVARALRSAYPGCFVYLVAGGDGTALAGASPELLVRRSGSVAVSQPMAGSVARGEDDSEDEVLAGRLLASLKDRAEHQVTSRHVTGVLDALSRRVVAESPQVVRLTNIQHLATTVRAELRDPPPNLLELASALHPTPAVNGSPAEPARRLIDELEGMERGWYAGGVGWIDAAGDGELAVAIRCGMLWEDGARIYAGVGVMPDSDPRSEVEETDLKLRALLGALSA